MKNNEDLIEIIKEVFNGKRVDESKTTCCSDRSAFYSDFWSMNYRRDYPLDSDLSNLKGVEI